jgi:ABC-type dipeptide/oligopeptide/nickel transport system permease component
MLTYMLRRAADGADAARHHGGGLRGDGGGAGRHQRAALVDGMNLEPEAKKALEDYYNRLYGLDQPAPVQYLRWLNNISPVGFARGRHRQRWAGFSMFKGPDLGMSFRYGRPVMDLIAERLPITLLLNVLSIPLIYVIAIAIGVQAARAARPGASM